MIFTDKPSSGISAERSSALLKIMPCIESGAN